MEEKLLIYGDGGLAKVIWDAAVKSGQEIKCFVTGKKKWRIVPGYSCYNTAEFEFIKIETHNFIVALEDNEDRREVYRKLTEEGMQTKSVIHPSSQIGRYVRIKEGTSVLANAVVNSGAEIGRNCVISSNAFVDYDCIIEDHAYLGPGVRLEGCVRIGEGAKIGSGSIVLSGLSVGGWNVVGPGIVVSSDIPERSGPCGSAAEVAIEKPAVGGLRVRSTEKRGENDMGHVTSIQRVSRREILQENIVLVMQTRFGAVPKQVCRQIERITEEETLKALLQKAVVIDSMDDYIRELPRDGFR
jgi:acetyltransferase EpsM